MKKNLAPALAAPVSVLHGVGGRVQEKLNRLGIEQVKDLLFHLPIRYSDRTRLCPIGALQPGTFAQVEGTIELTQVRFGRRRMLLCHISDGTGALVLRFFHFTRQQQDRLRRGLKVRCFGQARPGSRSLEMAHPEYQVLAAEQSLPVEETLTPVYPATEGLQQPMLRKLTGQALSALESDGHELGELLPDRILREFRLPELSAAIAYVHRPPPDAVTRELLAGIHPAQQRLAFEELLAHYLSLLRIRQQVQRHTAAALRPAGSLIAAFHRSLPFILTAAQGRAAAEIQKDLQKAVPMLRLLQGDVGAGKTVIAALAILQTVASGYQAAIMAPTELLAEQHYSTLRLWCRDLNVTIVLLTGKLGRAERRQALSILEQETPCIVAGTHALLQEDVAFSRLRLIVIDEQHRFGVHQRLALLDKGGAAEFPHQLIMTATPIPRTLAMTLYADLDISIIDELPPGRMPVRTTILSTSKRDEVIGRIARACADSRQIYWVCTLIEESESLQCEAAIETQKHLSAKLPGIRTGLIHGRLKTNQKDSIMGAFKRGEIDLLVATTVIEVGVDVPDASLMIIENAERLGLFQLHQLRGRVGRGRLQSDCVLLYQPPLSETARIRLDTLRNTSNGFEIAQKDLELRGPGDMMGTRQTGLPAMRIADLIRDAKLLPHIHKAGAMLMQKHPDVIQPLIERWLGRHFDYGKV